MLSALECILDKFERHGDKDAIVYKDTAYSYKELLISIEKASKFLDSRITDPSVVMLEANYSVDSIGMLFALLKRNCIVIPTIHNAPIKKDIIDIAQVQHIVTIADNNATYENCDKDALPSKLINELLCRKHAGIVLFTSGSTGAPKGVVHDAEFLLKKYLKQRHSKRTLAILLFDHIGGLDNLFYTLSNGGCLIICDPLTPQEACRLTEKYFVQVFPASPSFLNLLVLSEAYKSYDLSSVETMTYGAEMMPEYLLSKLRLLFPRANLLQKYGITEVGTLHSRSKSSDSLWVKIGGDGFKTRVVDGILQIKAESAMLGYLNAPSPFTDDGWFITGDEVEIDGDYYLIKGRRSEMINVGGQKVYPAEVESVILQMDGVLDAVITGEKNPILGKIVTAKVHLADQEETAKDFIRRMKMFCKDKLRPFQIPQKVTIEQKDFTNSRFKKIRNY